jgi:outer membrane protein assembly factor BamB
MKRLALLSLIGMAALALSACGTATKVSWPGLAADANNAYLANGNLLHAARLSDGLQLWSFPEKSSGQAFISNPVIAPDGQVLIASAGTDNGVYSLDPQTGRENWPAPLVADNHWVAPPLVVGDTLYAANNNGSLYAAELETGFLKWSLPLADSLWSAPTYNGKLIFAASLDHTLYAVDPVRQRVVWQRDLEGSAPGSATISSDGTTVYVGSFGSKVFALDAESGEVRWTAEARDWVWGAPAESGDTVFAADLTGRVYSLASADGQNAWPSLVPDGAIIADPVVLDDGVLVATESGSLYAFDSQGSKVWDITVGGQIYTTPVIIGDKILVAPMKGDSLISAVSLDGKLLPWTFTGK